MNVLLDTQLFLWAAGRPERLPAAARRLISDVRNHLFFSAASLWEITIKKSLGREDFRVDPRILYRGLVANGYSELPVRSEHTFTVESLEPLHKDPVDRLLLAQAVVEGLTLLTADEQLARYSGPVRKV